MKKLFEEPEITEEVVEPVTEEPVVEEVERVEAEVVAAGVVTADMLNVRSGPSTSYLPIKTLYKGDKVEYTVENEEWVKIIVGDHAIGYCMKQFIQ